MKSLVAYEKIRDMILVGEKLPGTRLVLTELESELGIGRGPIREALMRLDRSGLVKNVPYKGAIVANPPSKKEVVIIFNIRIEIETELAIEAMQHLGDQQIAELENLHHEMERMEPGFYNLDRKFHSIICAASQQIHLCAIVDKLILSVETFLTMSHQQQSDYPKFIQEHGEILAALKDKDVERLRAAMKNNINSGFEVAQRSISLLIRK